MTATVTMHPRAVEHPRFPRGLNDLDQFWQLRGFDLVLHPTSRFLHVEPKPQEMRETEWHKFWRGTK